MRKLRKEVWPYQTVIPKEYITDVMLIKNIECWCNQYIGKRFVHWYGYMNEQGMQYAFNDEETLLAFKLIWNYKQ